MRSSGSQVSFANLAMNAKRLAHLSIWLIFFIVPVLQVRAEMTVHCTDNPDHSVTTCRIDQPVVTQEARHGKAYPVTFRPGDLVTITAGGCVQTGGWGATWKRYVDPKGPNADRLYHGTIWIPGTGIPPGITKEIGTYLNRPIPIPATVAPPNNVLVLGYVDNGYDDNGYSDHDDGTDGQCRSDWDGGPAWLLVKIEHGKGDVHAVVPAPFDLVPDGVDSNGLSLNPKWGWEADPGSRVKPASNGTQSPQDPWPDPNQLCDGFTYLHGDPENGISLGLPPCTNQIGPHDIDSPRGLPNDINNIGCTVFGGRSGALHGHVNWWPATVSGHIIWHGHMTGIGFDPSDPTKFPPEHGDDDYCFYLFPANGGLGNFAEEYRGVIESEMDSDETVDHFGSGWWQSFHDAVDHASPQWDYSGGTPAAQMINAQKAIITGLVGIDEEHDGHSELHPIYAMAIQVNPLDYTTTYDPNKEADNDRWAVFARNWGDEGFCSQDQHYWDIPEVSIFIPEPVPSSDYAILEQEFFGSGGDKPLTVQHSKVTGGVLIKFGLGAPDNRPMVDGFLRIHWVPSEGTVTSRPIPSESRDHRRENVPARPPVTTESRPIPSGPRDHRGGNVPARPPLTTESHPIPSEPRDHRGGNVPARPPATTESSPIPSRDIGGLPLMFGSRPSEEMIAAMLARKREEPKLNLLKGLSPDKITWVKQQLKKPPVAKNTAKIDASRVALPADMSPHRAPAKITRSKMRTVYDTVRAEKFRHLREVLCAAHDNEIPDLPGVCSDVFGPPHHRPAPILTRPTPSR